MGKPALIKSTPPATVKEAFQGSHPIHRALGDAFEQLGGVSFLTDWAEQNPTDFVKILLALAPPPTNHGPNPSPSAPATTGGLHLHLHQGLAPGPLDGVIIEQG